MSRPNTLFQRRIAGTLAGAVLFATGAVAQITDGIVLRTNQTPALAVTLQHGELVGHEQVIRELIRNGTNEFVFVVPDGLRTHAPVEGQIVLIAQDMKYYVSIRIVGPPPTNARLEEALRERIASQIPNASSLEEFTTIVASREGTGFQLRQDLPVFAARFVRILWVPFKAGVLEFALNADSNNASAGQGALDMILVTFRSNERGRLEIVRRSDKT